MKCLSAFGVIIDTTKPSILGQKITKSPINLYEIIGIKAIDLITGDIEERSYDDISDIRIRNRDISNMYIGIDMNGGYYLYVEELDWWVCAYYNIGLLVYDVGTEKSLIVGKELVFYKMFETLIIVLNLSTCKLRYIHGEDTFYICEEYDDGCYHDGIPLPTSIGILDMQEDKVLLGSLTDKTSNAIIFDTTVIVNESKDTFIVPSKCKCLELSYRVVVDKLILNKDLCHIEVCDGLPFKTIYISKKSSVGLVCSLIYALASAYISKVGINGDIAYDCNCFRDAMERMPVEEAYEYCYLPENKAVLEKILSTVEIVVY
jgi:hypothetical protein